MVFIVTNHHIFHKPRIKVRTAFSNDALSHAATTAATATAITTTTATTTTSTTSNKARPYSHTGMTMLSKRNNE